MFCSNVLPRWNSILKCAAAILLVTQIFGCAAKPFEPTNLERHKGRSLSVVYLPTNENVHVEVYGEGKRYPYFQVSAANRALVSAATGGVATWASVGLANTINSGPIIVADPYAIAANVVVMPLINMGIELKRRSDARKLAKPFNEILSHNEVLKRLPQAVENELVREFGNTFSDLGVELVDTEAETSGLPGTLAADLVLVTTGVVAFSPRFEVLQLTLLYGLFDREKGFQKPIYRNKIVVQSAVHAGKLGDTTGVLEEAVSKWHAEELQRWEHMLRNHGKSAIKKARRDIRSKAKRRLRSALGEYRLDDDHDEDGMFWLEASGKEFRSVLPMMYEEAAYLLAQDLTGRYPGETSVSAVPPGTNEEMVLVPKLNRGTRVVYRQKGGVLISIEAGNRMIHLTDR